MRLAGGGPSFLRGDEPLAEASIQVRCDRAERIIWRDPRQMAILAAMTSSVRNTVTVKPRVRKTAAKKARTVKGAVAKASSPQILSAPKGVRTLSHSAIKQAVEKVFASR